MSRMTSWSTRPEAPHVSMQESVYGEGTTTLDALQSVLDNMERRVGEIRAELARLRAEGPYR